MSPCFFWRYFLNKFGISRNRNRSIAITDDSARTIPNTESERDDFIQPYYNQESIFSNNKYDISLLHPDWKRFPHAPIYGWTNDHEEQLKNLTNMIINGNLMSAYYETETEYRASRFLNNRIILSGPNVSDVNEAVLLLRRNKGFQYNSYCNESLLEYDADDESEYTSRSMERYYNLHIQKPRST